MRLQLFNRDGILINDLNKATNIQETLLINEISKLSFTMPINDAKTKDIETNNIVRLGELGERYVIKQINKSKGERGTIQIRALGISSNLQKTLLFGGINIPSTQQSVPQVITRLLDEHFARQGERWILGKCDFEDNYGGRFINETILSSLIRIGNQLEESYYYKFDTSTEPYVVNLLRIDLESIPSVWLEKRTNKVNATEAEDISDIFTRLYILSDDDEIDVRPINNGKNYIEATAEIIERYGLIERYYKNVGADNANLLLGQAKGILRRNSVPFEEYSADMIPTNLNIPTIGAVTNIVGVKQTYITGISWSHGEISKASLLLANRPRTLANHIQR